MAAAGSMACISNGKLKGVQRKPKVMSKDLTAHTIIVACIVLQAFWEASQSCKPFASASLC
jgi:hypothetical protein